MEVGKELLRQYIDAKELVKESQEEIECLRNKRKQIESDVVKASAKEFPYTVHSQKIEGLSTKTIADLAGLNEEEKLLRKRIEAAEQIQRRVEEWMLGIPPRKQRIIKYKFFDELTWGEVAQKLGRKATADSVRMELQNFFEKK